jgi:hypothetical protein
MVLTGAVILPHGALPFDNPESPSSACVARAETLDEQMKTKIQTVCFF